MGYCIISAHAGYCSAVHWLGFDGSYYIFLHVLQIALIDYFTVHVELKKNFGDTPTFAITAHGTLTTSIFVAACFTVSSKPSGLSENDSQIGVRPD